MDITLLISILGSALVSVLIAIVLRGNSLLKHRMQTVEMETDEIQNIKEDTASINAKLGLLMHSLNKVNELQEDISYMKGKLDTYFYMSNYSPEESEHAVEIIRAAREINSSDIGD